MPAERPIYLDNAATTPLDPRVLEAMMPFLTDQFGNASSRSHSYGMQAESEVEQARIHVAKLIGAKSPKEIIFTSGATESNNLAIKGVAARYRSKGNHIITCETEHKAVLDPCNQLRKDGFEITHLGVKEDGRLDLQTLENAITDKTILISIMLANNELGTLHPIQDIGNIAKRKGVLFHCDAVQGIAKVDFDVQAMQVDLASLSAHKMYGPKGIGALYLRRANPRVEVCPQIQGGGQERGLRSGTLNVPAIVGFGKAAQLAAQEWPEDSLRIRNLRNSLCRQIFSELDRVYLNGAKDPNRTPGHLNLSFEFVEAESLMLAMKNVAVSSGSACVSHSLEPSHVLSALGLSEQRRHGSIRFSIGKFNTQAEIDRVAEDVIEQVTILRSASPLYEMAKK